MTIIMTKGQTKVVSDDDPFCSAQRAHGMAADWGSEHVDVGVRGHINGDSGLGDWPEGLALLQSLADRAKR